MDPNATLKEMLTIAKRITKRGDSLDPSDTNSALVINEDATALAERVQALDMWLRAGNAVPRRWLTALETFEQAWQRMVNKGYRYGRDALENVLFGFRLARGDEDADKFDVTVAASLALKCNNVQDPNSTGSCNRCGWATEDH